MFLGFFSHEASPEIPEKSNHVFLIREIKEGTNKRIKAIAQLQRIAHRSIYTVKEKTISISSDVDATPLAIHAHTQSEYKKSQRKYGEKIETKKIEKVNFEESIFDEIVYMKSQGTDTYPRRFEHYATMVSNIAWKLHKRILLPNRVEYYTWKYLLTHNIVSHSVYIREKVKDYNIDMEY